MQYIVIYKMVAYKFVKWKYEETSRIYLNKLPLKNKLLIFDAIY